MKKYRGTAKKICGFGGEKYALFHGRKCTGESSIVATSPANHEKRLRAAGYRIGTGCVRESEVEWRSR